MGGWGHNQKITTKCHEIKRISTLTSSKTSLENAKARYGDFFTAIHSHLTLALMQLEKEEGVNPPPPHTGGRGAECSCYNQIVPSNLYPYY